MANPSTRIVFACFIGTAIEFHNFHNYGLQELA